MYIYIYIAKQVKYFKGYDTFDSRRFEQITPLMSQVE